MPPKKKELQDGTVLVFRNDLGDPVVIPAEVATKNERVYRCHQLRLKGESWQEIAAREHYPTAASVKAEVGRYMTEAASMVLQHSAREMLGMEVQRLDALQAAVWSQAMVGHIPSASLALNVIVQRAHLVAELDKTNVEGARTVVIPAADGEYMRALQAAAAENAKPS